MAREDTLNELNPFEFTEVCFIPQNMVYLGK